jgi:hypothetical protein
MSTLEWHKERLQTEIEELEHYLNTTPNPTQIVVAASKANIRYHRSQIELYS